MAVVAQHAGICPECDDYIHPGDPIVTTADLDWAHETCKPSRIEVPTTGVVCDICWMLKPCGCDDDG